jgi:hypothetical protein
MRHAIIAIVIGKRAAAFSIQACCAVGLLPARFAGLAGMAGIVVSASASSSAATATINFRPRFIHGKRSPAGVFAVQGGNGFFRFFIVWHFHKPKAA